MAKIGLMGFSRVKLFPVTQNDINGYATGEGFELPWAQEMTRDTDVSESKIYADDMLYLNMKSWNGMNSTITLAEMPLDMMAKLGFGEYNAVTKTLKWDPQGKNLQFGLSFRMLQADGNYRMMKMYCFTVNEIKESGIKTKGASGEVSSYQVIGTFTARVCDGSPGMIKDSVSAGDMEWLDDIE